MKKDARFEKLLAGAPEFARPILAHIRQIVHEECPDGEEAVKWSRPTFLYRGRLLLSCGVFKEHCGMGFWHAKLGAHIERERGVSAPESSSGQFGKITSLADLPDDRTLRAYIQAAMKLNETDAPARPPKPTSARKPELPVPDDLMTALATNTPAAEVFARFSPSAKREYIEWLTEAKRPETRQQRLVTAVAWIAEGKQRNWKYQNC